MKTLMYRMNHYLRYTLCGSCEKGIEWEWELDSAPTHTLCYCVYEEWFNLIKQFIKRKLRRKDEPIF